MVNVCMCGLGVVFLFKIKCVVNVRTTVVELICRLIVVDIVNVLSNIHVI